MPVLSAVGSLAPTVPQRRPPEPGPNVLAAHACSRVIGAGQRPWPSSERTPTTLCDSERVTNGDRAADRVDALLEAVLAVSSGLDLDVTLRSIVDAALELVDARYGALGVVDPDGDLIHFVFTGIDDETRKLIGSQPHRQGPARYRRSATATPIRLDDLTVHRRLAGLPPHHPPMRTFLGVPVAGAARSSAGST